MSACFDIILKVKFKSEEDKGKALNEVLKYIDSQLSHCDTYRKIDRTSFDSVVAFLLASHQGMFYKLGTDKLGYEKYSSGFNASYGWESVIMETFEIMVPYLVNRSSCRIDIENDYDMLVVKNGKYVQTH